jgi:TonB family protein
MRWALAAIAMLTLASSSVRAADPAPTFRLSSSKPAPSNSNPRLAAIPTHAGLRLVVKAACADVQIFTDASDSVSYRVGSDSKIAADPDFLRHFLFTVHNTPRGVVLIAPAGEESDCRVHVTYEIHVPRRYDLDVALQAGNIVTQDVEGAIALSTGGGEIRTGSIGARGPVAKDAANACFVAHLQTAAGDISVGNVSGGLQAATRGGQLSAGDVQGPAVLRTGGGDIRVGHVFGGAHFTSGGGDIVVQKVDGGLWADTAGGRVAIGDTARLSAAEPQIPAGFMDAFAAPEIRRSWQEPQVVPSGNDLADMAQFARLFDLLFRGAIRVDPVNQQSRLIHSIAPEYPDVARLAGIEGDVVLRIFVGRDGSIRDINPVSGPPVLARAAMRAVEEWRYAPALVNGRPVEVITSVTLAFRLHS